MVNVGNYAEVSYERGVHIDSNPIIRNFLSQCLGIDQRSKKLIGSSKRLDVDLVLMSGGWNPAVQLFSQSRGKLKYDYDINCP